MKQAEIGLLRDKAACLASRRVAFETVDERGGNISARNARCRQGGGDVALQDRQVDVSPGNHGDPHPASAVGDLVLDDLGEPQQSGTEAQGVDSHPAEVEVGVVATLDGSSPVTVRGARFGFHHAVIQAVADERLSQVRKVGDKQVVSRLAGRDGPVVGVHELDDGEVAREIEDIAAGRSR